MSLFPTEPWVSWAWILVIIDPSSTPRTASDWLKPFSIIPFSWPCPRIKGMTWFGPTRMKPGLSFVQGKGKRSFLIPGYSATVGLIDWLYYITSWWWGKPVAGQSLQQGWENLEKHNQSHDQTNPVDFYRMDNRLYGFSTLAIKTLQQKQYQEVSTSRKVGVTKTTVRRFQNNLMALDDI